MEDIIKTRFLDYKVTERALFRCGWIHLVLGVLFLFLISIDQRQLSGVNLWLKPLKFALSIGIYCLTWSILLQYFPEGKLKERFIQVTVFVMSFEMFAVASQAARGQLSHFNQTGVYNIILYAMMGLLITMQTVYALYMGYRFLRINPPGLSSAMLWAIRLGILIAGIFALQGGLMGYRMSHTVGAADGTAGLPLVHWSKTAGDLRIAHFAGLHALQLIPVFVYLFKIKKALPVIMFAVTYFALVCWLFYTALLGLPV